MSTTPEVTVSDSQLVDRFRGGDAEAASELHTRHYDMAVRLARRTGPHPDEAEELASEAFERVLQAIRAGGGPTESFSLYLRSSVRNQSLSLFRYRARIRTIDRIEQVVVDHVPDHADYGRDLDLDLAASFDRLVDTHRDVLRLRVLEGRSNRESAEILGMAPTAEAMLYFRARRALKKSYLATENGRLRTKIAAFRARTAARER